MYWLAGLFVVYWVVWAVLVERTVGLLNFAFFDTNDSPRDTPARRWAAWLVLALVLSIAVAYAGIRSPDPLAFLGMLVLLNTLYTAWAIPFVRRRLGRR